MERIFAQSPETARNTLIRTIAEQLDNNMPVLLLVSGGSTAATAVEIATSLQRKYTTETDKFKLLFSLSLIDERFGPEGHPDSNWMLLVHLGLVAKNFTTIPLLHDRVISPLSFGNAVGSFDSFLHQAVQKKEKGNLFIAGLFGIGTDGHTAGILPESPASLLDLQDQSYAFGYKSEVFTRITITPPFFSFIDLAVVWAGGKDKEAVIESLSDNIPYRKQPAQLLKHPQKTVIYSNIEPRKNNKAL